MKGKKFNMAGAGYRDADVYDCQYKAKESFFEDKVLSSDFKELQNEDLPSRMPEDCEGKVYDITGFDGQQVVAVLSLIVNNQTQFKEGENFYLLIRNSPEDHREAEYEALYRLKAAPTKDQPGNGILVLRPKGKDEFPEKGKRYSMLIADLKIHYETNTTSFAKDIKKLLKRNTQNKDIPEATIEAYMILLFEIARRLVKIENPTERKKALDSLPIGSAIARLINLLELRKSTFDDVFLPSKRFYCFKGEWDVRRRAIERINEATAMTGTVEQLLEELQELFCSDQRLEEISQSENLATALNDMSLNETP